MYRRTAAAAVTLAMAAAAGAAAQDVTTELIGNDGGTIGSIEATEGPHGIVLRVAIDADALAPGWHGIHVHEVGDCSDHAAFEHSEGHVNPGDAEHGFLNPNGPHPSDLPNIFAHDDGSSRAEVFIPGVTLTGGEVELIDDDGSAVVVHADADDHMTQPIGGAGDRVACAVLE
jgi:Cu-Zn family superoxide dismutase